MYRTSRLLHLLTGLFLVPMLWMYGWSAMRMAHPALFTPPAAGAETPVSLAPGLAPREAARLLRLQLHLTGDVSSIRHAGDDAVFRIAGIGVAQEVKYNIRTGSATVKTTPRNLFTAMHHWSGFWHEFSGGNLFAALALLTSLGIALLAVTGLVLWFRLHAERTIGITLLAVSLLWGFGLMIVMRFS